MSKAFNYCQYQHFCFVTSITDQWFFGCIECMNWDYCGLGDECCSMVTWCQPDSLSRRGYTYERIEVLFGPGGDSWGAQCPIPDISGFLKLLCRLVHAICTLSFTYTSHPTLYTTATCQVKPAGIIELGLAMHYNKGQAYVNANRMQGHSYEARYEIEGVNQWEVHNMIFSQTARVEQQLFYAVPQYACDGSTVFISILIHFFLKRCVQLRFEVLAENLFWSYLLQKFR